MLMPTSVEFVALCRSQIALLTQTLGATLSVVYLTQELVEGAEAQLVPLVAWPETANELGRQLALPSGSDLSGSNLSESGPLVQPQPKQLAAADVISLSSQHPAPTAMPEPVQPPAQLVVPLTHEGMVLGLLVTERSDRAWSEWDRSQVERIAQTLALGCVLDQRAQWLHQAHHQHHLGQAQQHDLFDNLLHQFRNPLTALRTFGKLLIKRLQPGENNYDVAASIVRESDRLQALLKQFEQAIDLPEVENLPLALAPIYPRPDSPDPALPPALLPAGVLTVDSLQLAPCDVTTVLAPLLLSATAMAQEKGLLLQTAIAPSLPTVWANADALCEVLSNLLDNAVKYTPTGGQIQVQAAVLPASGTTLPLPPESPSPRSPHSVMISISDTGVGIPATDLPHLFERHYRGVQATGLIPGTGLGLAIARNLLRQMQGDIQVISPMVREQWLGEVPAMGDQGTTVLVWLTPLL
jgi:signal transduction histidine kinase